MVFIRIIKLVLLKNLNFTTLANKIVKAIAAIASAIITNFYELI